jgi:hypothetical protein
MMARKSSFEGIESAPRWILLFLGASLLVHLFVLYLWNAAGQIFSIQGSSDSTGALSVTGMAAVNLWLCLLVLRTFPAGAPLRATWMLMTAAAAAATVAGLLAQLLGTEVSPIEQVRIATLVAGGPLRLALLSAALLTVLRTLRKFGFWVRPTAADWAVSAIVGLFAVCRFVEAAAANHPLSFEDGASLAELPILCVLSLEAMLLRQAVGRMGSGLIARVWMALVGGVLLTVAGEFALWVIPHFEHALPHAMFATLIRLPIAAAFALVPACQLAAQRCAVQPPAAQPEDLPSGVPALAR